MKKLFCLLFAFCMFITSSMAQNVLPQIFKKIDLRVYWQDPTPGNNPRPRTPIQAPDVYLDDHTLYFAEEFEDDLVVTLEDENEVGVYSTYLYTGQTQLSLPASLSGDYTLYIYKGNFAFVGEITLD